MYRSNLLKEMAAATVNIGTGAASAAAQAGPTLAPPGACSLGPQRRIRSCKIIGIGGDGCNLIAAFLSGMHTLPGNITAEFLCMGLDFQRLSRINSYGEAAQRKVPLKTISLGTYGGGCLVSAARVAALRHLALLKSALTGADAVMLVAGLGDGAGSGIAPMMARLARNAGAVIAAAVVMPFDWEGGRRNRNAHLGFQYLQREAALVTQVSRLELAKTMAEDISQSDFFGAEEQLITACIHAFLERENYAS
jgi:cell division protein FtsZ